ARARAAAEASMAGGPVAPEPIVARAPRPLSAPPPREAAPPGCAGGAPPTATGTARSGPPARPRGRPGPSRAPAPCPSSLSLPAGRVRVPRTLRAPSSSRPARGVQADLAKELRFAICSQRQGAREASMGRAGSPAAGESFAACLGAVLRRLRSLRHLSQDELGRLAGYDGSY